MYLADFAQEKAPDDYNDDIEPEWLEFEPQEKKFDFSKQVPLTKMFSDSEIVDGEELGGLEDEDENTEETQKETPTEGMPISIEDIEKQQLSQVNPQKPAESNFKADPLVQSQQDMGHYGYIQQPFRQPGMQPEVQQPFGQPGMQPEPQQPFGQPGIQLGVQQPLGQPGASPQQINLPPQQPFGQNQPGFGAFQQQEFSGPFGGFNHPENPEFSGFGENEGFEHAFGDSMGFGNSLFGAPTGRDEEFDKIFGQPAQQNPMEGLFPPQNQDPKGQQPGMFGFGVDQNQFMTGNEEEDEEDDWLMDDQFQGKNLEFIDQHDTPLKEPKDLIKIAETIEVAYKYT